MKVWLDTDIGTDVDDAMAMAVLLGSPEVELLGVSTVYGDTLLRARIASRIARLCSRGSHVPIVPGVALPLSGRDVYWSGHEGAEFHGLENEPVDPDGDAIDVLLRTVSADPGEISVLAIGPLTNIATALLRQSTFARDVKELIVMGGDFGHEHRVAEHNFRADLVATRAVFESDIRIVVGGLDLTTQLYVKEPEVERIETSGPVGAIIAKEIRAYWRSENIDSNHPNDPMLAIWAVLPDGFSSVRGTVSFHDDGLAVEREDEAGNVRILRGMHPRDVVKEIVERIAAIGAGNETAPE